MEGHIIVVPSNLTEKALSILPEHDGVVVDVTRTTLEKMEFICPSMEVAEAFGTAVFE